MVCLFFYYWGETLFYCWQLKQPSHNRFPVCVAWNLTLGAVFSEGKCFRPFHVVALLIHFFELNSTNYAAHNNPSSRPSLTAYQHLQSPKLPLMSVIKLNREFILPLIVPQTQTEDTAMNHEPTTHESPSNHAAPCSCPAIKTQFHPFTWNLYCLLFIHFYKCIYCTNQPSYSSS